MATFKHFNGDEQLVRVVPVDNAKFKEIGGVMTKHNRYDGFQRMAGFTADGRLVPVTRKIEYKSNPSKHVCNAKCRNATGHVCECECGGRYHGGTA